MEISGFEQSAASYKQSAFEIIKFSAAVATENRSMDDLFDALMKALAIERDQNGEIFKWIRSVIGNWREDSDYRKNAEAMMERSKQRLDGANFEGDIKTTHLQILQNILTCAGIDSTEEPWVSLINLAIKDEDPTRVLIDCEHINGHAPSGRRPDVGEAGLEVGEPQDHRMQSLPPRAWRADLGRNQPGVREEVLQHVPQKHS